jgi:hypothetical protein
MHTSTRIPLVVLGVGLLGMICGAGPVSSERGTKPAVLVYVLTSTGTCLATTSVYDQIDKNCPCQVDNQANWLQGCFTSGTWPCSCAKWTPDKCVKVEVLDASGTSGECDTDTGSEIQHCCFGLKVRFTASICCDSSLCYGDDWEGRCCPGGGSTHSVHAYPQDNCKNWSQPNPTEPLIYNVGTSNPQVSIVWADKDIACTIPPPSPNTYDLVAWTQCNIGSVLTASVSMHAECGECQ